jgi:uncharacterized protein (TIGR03382 family)
MMTKRAFVFGLVALPACAGGGPDTSTVGQDIIGGEVTQTSDWKSVVALEETPGDWFCTGTLITDQWVLTAAHCIGASAANLHIRFDSGDVNNGQNGYAVAVAEIHANPAFDYDAWDNDVALIKLAQPVTDRTPTPIDRDPISFGSHVIDVGYGDAENNNKDSGGVLRKVEKLTADCAGANDPGIINDNLLCMDASDGRGSCYGDSGGPAFIAVSGAFQVAGITSGGTGELCGAGWDLYTSVHGELAFIDSVTGATTPPDPGTGDGSGSGSNDPSDPKPGDGDDGGCSAAGGSSSGLFAIAFAAVLRRRRRNAATHAR